MACTWAGKVKGVYLATMAKILAWLGGKMVVLEDELEGLTYELEVLENVVEVLEYELGVFGDGNKTLAWRGSLGMNDYVEWSVVEIIDDVVLNKDEFTDSEGMVEGLGVSTIRATNSTDLKMYSILLWFNKLNKSRVYYSIMDWSFRFGTKQWMLKR